VRVRLTPNSRRDNIGGTLVDENNIAWLKVSVRAVPENGQANLALIDFLAKWLGIAKSRIRLLSGSTNRAKKLAIADVSQSELEELQSRSV